MLRPLTIGLILCAAARGEEPRTVVPLWPNGAPGFESRKAEPEQAESYWVKNVHNPTLTVFLPPAGKANGSAVVIFPGGGHRLLVFNAEGVQPAEYLTKLGVAAFVLKYRLAREPNSPYDLRKHPREDAQRAIRLVRSRAKEWGVDPKRVGVLGFSAGGEVASVVAYEKGDGDPGAADAVDRENARPDFQMLVYPGPLGIPDKVPPTAPPAFFLVSNDDMGAAKNIVSLLQKYRDAKVSVEAHILARGGHGFNMGDRSKLQSVHTWPQRMADWMNDNYLFDPARREADEKAAREKKRREGEKSKQLKAIKPGTP